jgi:hypothetical protein
MSGPMTGAMRRALRCAPIAAIAVWAAAPAAADPVRVQVIDVAGGMAYVSPGRAAGLVPGTKVKLRGVELTVVEVTEKTAVVRLDTQRIAIGDAGTADVTPSAAAAIRRLPKPRPPELFVGQWADPVRPATLQEPRPVALGSGRPPGRAHVTVIGKAFGAADRSSRDGDVEGRVIASFDLMTDRPLAADLDVSGRAFLGGWDRGTRTPVLVRAAQLRYGDARDPRFALGRLRHAASSVGMLDGGRASARVGDVEVAAFGGLVPDPLSGEPDTGAARFGGEVVYDAAAAAWQPRIAVAAHGSTWDGALDERRLSVVTSASRGALWLDGWAELQAFPAGNPFDARSLELTGAGAAAQWRKRGRHLAVDVSFLRPERSLRLAAALPLEWLCTPLHVPGDVATTCGGAGWWASATTSAGVRAGPWSVDGIGTIASSHGVYRGLERSGYLRGERRFGRARAEAAVSGGKASFGSWTAGEIGGGYAPTHRADVSVRYRPELLDHVASTGPAWLHSIIADGRYRVSAAVDLALSAAGTRGLDRDALAVLAILAWRPLP